MKKGDVFVVRVGYEKSVFSELNQVMDKIVLRQSSRPKVKIGQIWKVKIVDLSNNPTVYLVHPIKQVTEDQFREMSKSKKY